MDTVLYDAVNQAGIEVKHVAEVGVLSFNESAVKKFCFDGIKCDLYEAIPKFCKNILEEIKEYPNATLHAHAVSNFNGDMTLCMAGASTFDYSLEHSPAIDQDGKNKDDIEQITVECRDFSEVDPGDYDVISIDVEGGEWSVLSRMVSRPMVISLETQSKRYTNPYLGSITDWMVANGYKVWIWNNTDTIFFNGNPPSLGLKNKLRSKWHNLKYYAGRL